MSELSVAATSEREGLLDFLGKQRYALRIAAYGLTDEQARSAPSASSLSIGGLVKHLSSTEQGWIDRIRGVAEEGSADDYMAGFRMGEDETLAGLLDRYDEVARATDAYLADVDFDQQVPVPKGVPWHRKDLDFWTARWIVLHLIEETARHAGHADIIRESIDGATASSLTAAAEGWPESPWVKPWKPPA
jgi:uncharacterized damage-inducible protein DinB